MQDLRIIIRQILAEELGQSSGGRPEPDRQIETVTLRGDADLNAFVKRLVQLARDSGFREAVESGRHAFRLDAASPHGVQPAAASGHRTAFADPVRLERTLVTERDVAALAQGTSRVRVSAATRFTPLARDELRRRGIKIERIPQ
jgi:hypothetical protein